MGDADEIWFSHERLEVYREIIAFIGWLSELLEDVRAGDVKEHLERASNSMAFNTAEGNGKFTAKDRCKFFDIAHGSTLECASGLDVLVARRKLTIAQIRPGKQRLQGIVKMLMGLIKRNSARGYEKVGRADE